MRCLVVVACLAGCGSRPAAPPAPSPPPQPAVTPTAIASTSPGIELPEVGLVGYAAAADVTAKISVSPTAYTIAGTQVLGLRDGALAPGDRAKLEAAIGADTTIGIPGVALAFDRRVPVATLLETVRILHARGASQFQLLARAGAGQVAVSFGRAAPVPSKDELARLKPVAGIDRIRAALDRSYIPQLARCHDRNRGALRGQLRLEMVVGTNGKVSNVALTGADTLHACLRDQIAAWSFAPAPTRDLGMAIAIELPAFRSPNGSGRVFTKTLGGKQVTVIDSVLIVESPSLVAVHVDDASFAISLDSPDPEPVARTMIPRAAATAFADLTSKLVQLVQTRWPHGRAFDIDHEISIGVTDPSTPVQLLAELMGAVRVSPDGFPLFPEIRLVVK